jgi:hypothetical protein
VNLTFAVGTGRCGSTMLSYILAMHPDILSVSEFFGILCTAAQQTPYEFPTGEMDGQQLWTLLAGPDRLLDAQISAGLMPPEMRPPYGYPYGRGRFNVTDGVPLICHNLLPGLTGDPDALFDELAGTVPAWPRRPAPLQYLALFGLLARLLGRRVVVERSGASLELIPMLHRHYPQARFVHMHRDGPDCALSMSRHPTFRRQVIAAGAAQAVGLPPSAGPRRIAEALPRNLRGLVYPPFDAATLMNYPIPLSVFGREIWSRMICSGMAALKDLDADMWTGLKYESLMRDPRSELTRVADFIEVPAPASWLEEACRLIDPSREGAAAAIDPEIRTSLRDACAPGTDAISAAIASAKP